MATPLDPYLNSGLGLLFAVCFLGNECVITKDVSRDRKLLAVTPVSNIGIASPILNYKRHISPMLN